MRRIAGSAALTSLRRTESPIAEPAGLESTVGSAMREGILPSEGVDAFDRIVGVRPRRRRSSPRRSTSSGGWPRSTPRRSATDDDDAPAAGGPQYERPNISSDYVPPATPIERELATMWRELLGVERVGRDDDFFELGGQSLIAVRLFTRMKKRYSIDLPLSTLFEAPTIAECAVDRRHQARHRRRRSTATARRRSRDAAEMVPPPIAPSTSPAFRSLVTIQRGNENLIPFFCIHGSGGNVLNFRDLSQAMGRSQPFYGLQSRGIDGVSRPHHSIEEMATAYLDGDPRAAARGPVHARRLLRRRARRLRDGPPADRRRRGRGAGASCSTRSRRRSRTATSRWPCACGGCATSAPATSSRS